MSEKNRVYIFDTTMRDGEQSPGASMSLDSNQRGHKAGVYSVLCIVLYRKSQKPKIIQKNDTKKAGENSARSAPFC